MLESALLEDSVGSLSINAIVVASAIIGVATLISFLVKKKGEPLRWGLFLAIAIPSVLVTVFLAGSTIYLNMVADTKGPIHWHTDFEIWDCGKKVDMLDPTGLENRLGTPLLHEHDDDRIHVEGTVVKLKDIGLSEFFSVIGGKISDTELRVPTNDGELEVRDGDLCNGEPGKLQVFLDRVTNPGDLKNWEYTQQKLGSIDDYTMAPYSLIPPGDCLIIEFGEDKPKTDKICETYKISLDKGEMHGG